MNEVEVTEFLAHLARDGHVAASTQNQALSALLFLYKEVLKEEIGWLDMVERAQKPARLPVVLTRDEGKKLFAGLTVLAERWMRAVRRPQRRVSTRTWHLFTKLGVESRTSAASYYRAEEAA